MHKTNIMHYAARDFAVYLHNSWGVGSESENNGIVLFISVEDRVLYISTGASVKALINTYSVIELMKAKTMTKRLNNIR